MYFFTPDRQRSVLVTNDREMGSLFAATKLCNSAAHAIQEKGLCTIALSGGSTPLRIYEILLASPTLLSLVDWSKVLFFWSDERVVPTSHPESNFGQAMKYLSQAPLEKAQKFAPYQDNQDAKVAAYQYDKLIKEKVPGEQFDVLILGMGEDGHTASLFPHTEALSEQESLVTANYVPEKKSMRITFTYPLIDQAKKILIIAFGDSKKEILKEVLYGKKESKKYPIQRIGIETQSTIFIIDREAAALLPIPNP